MKHRHLDPELDWMFFDPDLLVPNDCLFQIRPLTEKSALELWREFISPEPVHTMELSSNAWSMRLNQSEVFTKWKIDWNENSRTTFIEWLRAIVLWPDSTPIFFSWSAHETIETVWSVFCRYWRNFLFDDEGPVLWSLQYLQAVRFLPSGAYVGQRALPVMPPQGIL